jgi:hypothetical protein
MIFMLGPWFNFPQFLEQTKSRIETRGSMNETNYFPQVNLRPPIFSPGLAFLL